MKSLHVIAFILVVVGAINWGLVAFGWNVVNLLVGTWPVIEMIIYILVGLSGIYLVFTHKKECKACASSSSAA